MNPRIQSRGAVAARTALAPLAASLLSLVTACADTSAPHGSEPTPVRVRTVEAVGAGAVARYSGTLEPAAKVEMAFRVGGYVEELATLVDGDGKRRSLDRGDFVTKGTVLARIRAADYAQKLSTARAQLTEARSEQKLAELELDRAKRLFESKAITKAELDAKAARAEAGRAAVAGATARSGEIAVALDDTVLRAPMDGVVLARPIEVGSLVAPGQVAVTLADTKTVKATFAVPQSIVEKLALGTPVQIFVGSDGEERGRNVDATITRIAPAADTKGRVFAVEAALANESGALRAGSVVSVRIPDAPLSSATMAVPLAAVVRAPKTHAFAVFVLEGDAPRAPAHLREVRLGEVLGNSVTVEQGLALGQRVVTVGSTLLRDGSEAVVIP